MIRLGWLMWGDTRSRNQEVDADIYWMNYESKSNPFGKESRFENFDRNISPIERMTRGAVLFQRFGLKLQVWQDVTSIVQWLGVL